MEVAILLTITEEDIKTTIIRGDLITIITIDITITEVDTEISSIVITPIVHNSSNKLQVIFHNHKILI